MSADAGLLLGGLIERVGSGGPHVWVEAQERLEQLCPHCLSSLLIATCVYAYELRDEAAQVDA